METIYADVAVVGSGAAGYQAACSLQEFGNKRVILITEGRLLGTSRNTGSDKQTYYKLGLGGDNPDSVRQMARDLFACGSVDGDNALCEAALSSRCFLRLCEQGVAFPQNRYGEYIGYKTDHDPYARATSAGPLTSRFMTEALERRAAELGITVLDGLLAIEVLKTDERVCGLLCLDRRGEDFTAVSCEAVVLATGGPAGIYADSVYPVSQTGMSSLAIGAGAKMQNLTEWQYGLASVNPRWNVSGTYMQVLPRFVAVDGDGTEHEFLADYFDDVYDALSEVFLKGYQWPFDSRKAENGSSRIDLMVYDQCVRLGRRVFLDYRQNPFSLETVEFSRLSDEARGYLEKAGALFGTPFERLMKMNMPAIDLYRSKGVDLEKEMLEIALCAQHNNGGVGVDLWWQTSVPGLFAAGECAGTHGVTRPGGSALNAGQVGAVRAARYISAGKCQKTEPAVFEKVAGAAYSRHRNRCRALLRNEDNVERLLHEARRKMSDVAGAVRQPEAMQKLLVETEQLLIHAEEIAGVADRTCLFDGYKLLDCWLTQATVLRAMLHYAETVGKTRGSALYGAFSLGEPIACDDGESRAKVQEITFTDDGWTADWRPVRPIPEGEDFFEQVWAGYRRNENIY